MIRGQRPRNGRCVALMVLRALQEQGAFLQNTLDAQCKAAELDDRERRLAWELVLGTARWLTQLDDALGKHLKKNSLMTLEVDVRNALRLGAYQILFLDRVPDHAAVSASVDLAKRYAGAHTGGLVNAVLRSLLRTGYTPPQGESVRAIALRYGHPRWLVKRYHPSGGDGARQRCIANNDPAPLTIRIKPSEADATLKALEKDGAEVTKTQWSPNGYHLANHPHPFRSESFQSGQWTVQDEASQLVVCLLDVQPDQNIWDVCAAPGGKTRYISELMRGSGRLLATDINDEKVQALRKILSRTHIDVRTHDGLKSVDESFDRILLDAPCSALGLVRRHPEIRWRRTPEDVQASAHVQSQLLENAAAHLKEGGVLVYSVCSDMKEEGPEVIDSFLKAHPEFSLEGPDRAGYAPELFSDNCLSMGPQEHGSDGFFAARLRRGTEPDTPARAT